MATTTWNPNDKSSSVSLSNSDLTIDITSTNSYKSAKSIYYSSTSKWYWEVTINVDGPDHMLVGVANSSASVENYCGVDTNGWGYYGFNGNLYYNGSPTAYGNQYRAGDIVGVALDMDNGEVYFSVNGTWQNSSDPVSRTAPAFTGISGDIYAMCSLYLTGQQLTANFGASSFSYTVPSGFNEGFGALYAAYCAGYVYEKGSPVQRTLYLYTLDGSGGVELIDSTTSSGNGYYVLYTTSSGAHFVVCLDDDAGEDYNHLILKDPDFTVTS